MEKELEYLNMTDLNTMPNGFTKAAIKRTEVYGSSTSRPRKTSKTGKFADITTQMHQTTFGHSAGPYGSVGFEIIYEVFHKNALPQTLIKRLSGSRWKRLFVCSVKRGKWVTPSFRESMNLS